MHSRPRRLIPLLAGLTLAIAVGGCAATGSSDAPAGSPSVVVSAASSAPPSIEPTSAPSTAPETTQTDTSWGRIWDDLPRGFPVPPEATIADDATAEPVSGAFAIPGGDPAQIA